MHGLRGRAEKLLTMRDKISCLCSLVHSVLRHDDERSTNLSWRSVGRFVLEFVLRLKLGRCRQGASKIQWETKGGVFKAVNWTSNGKDFVLNIPANFMEGLEFNVV